MRVLILTYYYPPELGAPQTRLREVGLGLKHLGHDVRVLTGPPHYPDGQVRPGYRAWRPERERLDDIEIARVPVWPRPSRGLLDRVIDQGSFAVSALAAIGDMRWSDVMLVESPPLFLGITAATGSAISTRPYVFHVADPWPDFPVQMGALSNPAAIRAAQAIEVLAYRRASLVTTVTPGLVELLAAKPSAAGKVRLLPNGVDLGRFDPNADRRAARRALGWREDAFTLVYAGSVGRAQGLGTLLDSLSAPLGRAVDVHVVGAGYERQVLAEQVASRAIQHVQFDDPVPSSMVPTLLAAADGVLVLLRRGPLYDLSLPTKLVEGLAAGRPIVLSAGGDAAAIVADHDAGYVSLPEDAADLRRAILVCADDRHRDSKGRAGRHLAESMFDRTAIVDRLAGYLQDALNKAEPSRDSRAPTDPGP